MRHDTILEMVKHYYDTIQKESNTEFMYIRKYEEKIKKVEKKRKCMKLKWFDLKGFSPLENIERYL